MAIRNIVAGTQQAWIAFVSNDKNIIYGGTTSAPAAGAAVSNAIQLVGIQTAPSGIPESTPVAVSGDDAVLGTFDFESDSPVAFVINVAEADLTKIGLLQNTLVETDGNINTGLLQPISPNLPDVALLIQGKAKNTGSNGASAWYANLYLRCTLRYLGRETFSNREAGSFRFQVVAQPATNKPTGVTITTAINGSTGATVLELSGNYPMTMARFTGNGALQTFTGLTKTPVSGADSTLAIDAVKQTQGTWSFNTSNKTITTTGTPANGAAGVVIYGYSD